MYFHEWVEFLFTEYNMDFQNTKDLYILTRDPHIFASEHAKIWTWWELMIESYKLLHAGL